MSGDKLYVVVRQDLAPGAQACQGIHAAMAFQRQNLELCQGLENLALLGAPNERALAILIRQAENAGIPWEGFQEPDFGDSLTAVCLAPAASRLVSSLPKLLRDATEPGRPSRLTPSDEGQAPPPP